jgi:hypothetical protein
MENFIQKVFKNDRRVKFFIAVGTVYLLDLQNSYLSDGEDALSDSCIKVGNPK